jgi:hypothetical protein
MRFASRQSAYSATPRLASDWPRAAERWNGSRAWSATCGALEIVLSGDDFDDDIAERYGWVTRTLNYDDLDSFVDALAWRLAGFDLEALAAARPCSSQPSSSAQARRAKVRGIGYGVPSGFELNFGWYLPAFGRADDHTNTQPD